MSPEAKSYYPIVEGFELFPEEKVAEIKRRGDRLLSPYWVLRKFDIAFGRNKRQIAMANLLQSNYGNEIRLVETKRGTRIYARDIDPLLKAVDLSYPTIIIDFGTKQFKKQIERAFH